VARARGRITRGRRRTPALRYGRRRSLVSGLSLIPYSDFYDQVANPNAIIGASATPLQWKPGNNWQTLAYFNLRARAPRGSRRLYPRRRPHFNTRAYRTRGVPPYYLRWQRPRISIRGPY